MRKIGILALLIFVIGVVSFSSHPIIGSTEAFGQGGSKVLMIIREGRLYDPDLSIKMEVGTMMVLLKKAGFGVDVASVNGEGDNVSGRSQKIEKLLRLSEVKLDDYVGVIIPCMGAEDVASPKMLTTIKDVVAKGKPIAASFGAVAVLGKAGVLKGRKFALMLNPSDPLFKGYYDMTDFEGATYSGPGVVQDGKIITGGTCPIAEAYRGVQNRTFELTQTFIAAIKPK